MFKDRIDAGSQLSQKLRQLNLNNAIVLGIPTGGVEVGFALSIMLKLPLDVILIKKIGHPAHNDLAIGAVSQYGRTVDVNFNISKEYVESETFRIRESLEKKHQYYTKSIPKVSINGKTVILTDDGIATGHTMFTAIEVIKSYNPSKIIVAAPVASPRIINILKKEVDLVICEISPENLHTVGQFYSDFNKLSDDETIAIVRKANEINFKGLDPK